MLEPIVVRGGRRREGALKEEGEGEVEVVEVDEARRRVQRSELMGVVVVFTDASLDAMVLAGSDLSIKVLGKTKREKGRERQRGENKGLFRAQRELGLSLNRFVLSTLVISSTFSSFYMAPRKSNKIVSVPVSQPSLDSWISLPGSVKAKASSSSSNAAASSSASLPSSSSASTSLAALDAELITYSDPLTEKDSVFL